jgi:hypothetical protein
MRGFQSLRFERVKKKRRKAKIAFSFSSCFQTREAMHAACALPKQSCAHVESWRERNGMDNLRVIIRFAEALRNSWPQVRFALRPARFARSTTHALHPPSHHLACSLRLVVLFQLVQHCAKCSSSWRLQACVSCTFCGCVTSGHISEHANATQHVLSFSLYHLSIYCHACRNFRHSAEIDSFIEHEMQRAIGQRRFLCGLSKERFVPTQSAAPLGTEESSKAMIASTERTIGLRGLNNLGSTCFMNSILQSHVHNAPLRNFFLSNQHTRQLCKLRSKDKDANCMACEMDHLFSQVLTGTHAPFTPHSFLFSVWKYSDTFAGNTHTHTYIYIYTHRRAHTNNVVR